jgi:hypothetical protein
MRPESPNKRPRRSKQSDEKKSARSNLASLLVDQDDEPRDADRIKDLSDAIYAEGSTDVLTAWLQELQVGGERERDTVFLPHLPSFVSLTTPPHTTLFPLHIYTQESIVSLQAAIDQYSPLPDTSNTFILDTPEKIKSLISYSHRLAYTSFAPPGFVPGQTQLRHFKPPAPQELEMRASQLHQLQKKWEEMQQAGRAAAAYGPSSLAQQQQQQPPTTESVQKTEQKQKQSEIETLEAALKELPPIPKGWKPGQPIPGLLPIPPPVYSTIGGDKEGKGAPAPAAAAAVAVESNKAQAVKPAVQAKPVSVAFNFALNPDLDIEFDVSDSEEESSSDENDGDE